MRAHAIHLFTETFGATPSATASVPGYMPLLGEADGQNGGPLLAVAARGRIAVAVAPGDEGFLDVIRAPECRRERLDLTAASGADWGVLLGGVLRALGALGPVPRGARIAVVGDLPDGVGDVALASLAVAAARAFAALVPVRLSNRQLAGVGFRAEPDGLGRGGVAAHTVVAMARPGHALLVERTSADSHQVPFTGSVLLVDVGPVRSAADEVTLATRRRAECHAALERLRLELPELVWLATWPSAWLSRLKKAVVEPARSRALHVLGEAARARFGAQLLASGRRKAFGALLYESHESLRRLYDASAPELDLVVAAARRAGALGARATGSGGEVIVIPPRGGGTKVERAIRATLARAHVREPQVTVLRPDAGVRLERGGRRA